MSKKTKTPGLSPLGNRTPSQDERDRKTFARYATNHTTEARKWINDDANFGDDAPRRHRWADLPATPRP
jgi:hypothetical protein